jgi:hypothetical protein
MGLFASVATFGAWACTPVTPDNNLLGYGVYCLDSDLVAPRDTNTALILASNSVLDCRGHKIKDPTLTAVFGVYILTHARNVVLKNCIFEGFIQEVYSNSARDVRILNNSFSGAGVIAIFATDTDGLIEGNTFDISGTGGDVVAINGNGILDIIGNTILSAQAPPEASGHTVTGIVASVHGGVIANNIIRNLRGASGGHGLAILAQGPVVISGNVIVNPPGTGDRGIYCRGPTTMVSNVVMGFATPYLDCPR